MGALEDLFARRYAAEAGLCFVLMPFHPNLDSIYRRVIKPSLEKSCNMRCLRADEIYSEKPIIGDVWELIQRAEIIVADLTDKNPNVLYELGLCHVLWKRVVLIAQRVEDIPFDLRHLRVIPYEPSLDGAEELSLALVGAVEALRSSSSGIKITFPEDGQHVYGEFAVRGKFERVPEGREIRVFVASTHDERIWPQGSVIFDGKSKTWRCRVNLWEHPKPEACIFIAELGESSRILCDYYGVVGFTAQWIPLKKLTTDAIEHDRVIVVNDFNP
jgi:hypothetical protein